MKFHWKVLIWMVAGVLLGLGLQFFVEGASYTGVKFKPASGGIAVSAVKGPAKKSKLSAGMTITALVEDRDKETAKLTPLLAPEDFARIVASRENGDVLWLRTAGGKDISVPVGLDPASPRAKVLAPFAFAGDIFLALLKMLIMPLIFASIVSGVAGLGSALELRRMGLKTFAYYTASSLVAILVGQVLVNLLAPGEGAQLGLTPVVEAGVAPDASFIEVLKRMVPSNVFDSLTQNGAMLQVIFFALVFGYCYTYHIRM